MKTSKIGGTVLKGLKKGDKVIFEKKEYSFVEYQDYGFTCLLKPIKGENIKVFGTQITRKKNSFLEGIKNFLNKKS